MTVIVAGATGLAGTAITTALKAKGDTVVGINRSVLNLLDARATQDFIQKVAPTLIVDAAAMVGGIGANSAYPVEFLNDNF